VVIHVLLELIKSGYNHISGIGIITPYDAQKRKIRSEVNNLAKVLLLFNILFYLLRARHCSFQKK
jgi:hypothetical protein